MALPPKKTAADVRELFLTFFETKQHTRVQSSSLVPANDPTLLFTNAGMNQFKDVFLGTDKRDYTRATSSQKCVRAGGKHNDLDNVGYTARHHTFFEMLGNFSFGDYFKKDAILYAWEFLTSPAWLALPTDRLYVTVYYTDEEAVGYWHRDVGLALDRIIRIGDNKGAPYASDNFWAMGDTGPCGPCTEIFYDHGAHIAGGLPGTPEEDGDRYIEIWNCVFMQFNRTQDGVLHPLPKPCVDTGMGLERISAVMAHVNSNYDIDIFQALMHKAASVIGIESAGQPSLKVLADHIRSCSFLIADGVYPSNEGRGYVLRRIIRRAIRHGHKLGATEVFFYKLVDALVQVMGSAYPELVQHQERIENALRKEEEQFIKTLDQGLKQFEVETAHVKNVIPGSIAFKLYDTYGFPLDLTADIARERGLTIDQAGFDAAMDEQRKRARDAGKFTVDYNSIVKVDGSTVFKGYDTNSADTHIVALYKASEPTNTLEEGDEGLIVLSETPFYAESGGQVGDTGRIHTTTGVFEVHDTKKSGDVIVHQGVVVMGVIHTTPATATIDYLLRERIKRNHSATHLLHAALRQVLGAHVEQKGSLVTAEGLRFDFSQHEPVAAEALLAVERLVTEQILANTPVSVEEMEMQQALDKGAMALFGEKYGHHVRVLSMGDAGRFSVELCGGTHVARTGDIGAFKIVSESGIAAGVRRIEAKTGLGALDYWQVGEQNLQAIAQITKSSRDLVSDKVNDLYDRIKGLEKELERADQKLAALAAHSLLTEFVTVNTAPVLIKHVLDMDSKSLKTMAEALRAKKPDSVFVLLAQDAEKMAFIAYVGAGYHAHVKAGEMVSYLASQVGGKGGGKPDFAQGGAALGANVANALAALTQWLQQKLV